MIYQVLVKPNSKFDLVDKIDDGLVVRTKAKAVDNKANEAVIRLLSKHFGVAKGRVKIIRGLSSKHKLIEVML
ncbi:DUF167 domain-containing protein [Candidatus Saccharibacteria bacterium]|nr:DUF167 domain-containing protein [Candidatus Saccharibacteria bacterium]